MRKEINENELQDVVGGTVVMSEQLKMVGFNTSGEMYKTKGDYRTMRKTVIDLEYDHPNMSNADFDQLVKQTFQDNGWI